MGSAVQRHTTAHQAGIGTLPATQSHTLVLKCNNIGCFCLMSILPRCPPFVYLQSHGYGFFVKKFMLIAVQAASHVHCGQWTGQSVPGPTQSA